MESVHSGPTEMVSRIAFSSAMQDQIPLINPPQPNVSYTMNFFGPALSCHTENSTSLSNLAMKSAVAFRRHSFPVFLL